MKVPAAVRRVLQSKYAKKSPIVEWLTRHSAALEFVEAWLEMRDRGETDWGVRRMTEYLREHHGYPYGAETSGRVISKFEEAVAWRKMRRRKRKKGRTR